MALTPDRQGYLGNLDMKTLPQLKELLERQEKLLSDVKLVQSLADKGERVKRFSETLKQKIRSHTEEFIGGQFVSDENLSRSSVKVVRSNDTASEEQTIDALLTRNEENHIIVQRDNDQNENSRSSSNQDVLGQLSADLQELHICKKEQDAPIFSNSYEKVIKRSAENLETSKPKYLPNRSLKYPIESSPSLHKAHLQQTEKKETKLVEESAVVPPHYAHQSTKLISIEESVMLIQEQRKRTENLAAERAAQRLAEHMGTKMNSYIPKKSSDLQYRETKTDDASDLYDSDDIPSDTDEIDAID